MADQRARLREALEAGAFGLSTGLDYPPGSYASTEELAELADGGGPARRDLPHPRPVPPGRRVPGPVPRGDRDRAAVGRPGPHHPLLPPADVPRPARGDARARRRRARRGPRRHVRPVPVRVGEHAAADHAAELDPGGRPRAAPRAPRRPGRPDPDPRRVGRPRPPLRRRPLVGRGPARVLRASRERRSGRAGRSGSTSRRRASTRSTRSATSCSPRTSGSTRSRRVRTGRASIGSSATRRR